jgi:hypothetical protein
MRPPQETFTRILKKGEPHKIFTIEKKEIFIALHSDLKKDNF